MSRSVAGHRLPNWQFIYSILRKLRLPIYDPDDLPRCWCGKTHDAYGDHIFRCTVGVKHASHNYIRDSWARSLQPVLATAGYIRPTAKLETEKKQLIPFAPGARPFDISLDPDPNPAPHAPECPFTSVGGDVTITHCPPPTPIHNSDNAIELLTAAAESHLQTTERAKLRRADRVDSVNKKTISGDRVIGWLIRSERVLLPWAIDPHGRWGPIFENFLFHHRPRAPQKPFAANRPNAQLMLARISQMP